MARALVAIALAVLATVASAAERQRPVRESLPIRASAQGSGTAGRLSALRGGAAASAAVAKRVPPSLPEVLPSAAVMAAHGLMLAGCGMAGAGPIGTATGLTMLTCAGLTCAGSMPAYMVGVHVALLVQLVSASGFAVQAARSSLVPPVWSAMSVSSAAAFGAMYKLKPKKEKKAS